MKFSSRTVAICFSYILCASISSGCTEYWWTRGQPPGTSALFKRAQTSFSESLATNKSGRADIAPTAESLAKSLSDVVSATSGSNAAEVNTKLTAVRGDFLNLEGKLSIGSRAAYGELSGQLRALSNAPEKDDDAVQLFAARTLFFLSNELSVPAPV